MWRGSSGWGRRHWAAGTCWATDETTSATGRHGAASPSPWANTSRGSRSDSWRTSRPDWAPWHTGADYCSRECSWSLWKRVALNCPTAAFCGVLLVWSFDHSLFLSDPGTRGRWMVVAFRVGDTTDDFYQVLDARGYDDKNGSGVENLKWYEEKRRCQSTAEKHPPRNIEKFIIKIEIYWDERHLFWSEKTKRIPCKLEKTSRINRPLPLNQPINQSIHPSIIQLHRWSWKSEQKYETKESKKTFVSLTNIKMNNHLLEYYFT